MLSYLQCCGGLSWLVLYGSHLSSDLSCSISVSLQGNPPAFLLNAFGYRRSSPILRFFCLLEQLHILTFSAPPRSPIYRQSVSGMIQDAEAVDHCINLHKLHGMCNKHA